MSTTKLTTDVCHRAIFENRYRLGDNLEGGPISDDIVTFFSLYKIGMPTFWSNTPKGTGVVSLVVCTDPHSLLAQILYL